MTTGDSSQEQNRLRVANGDTIYIEYDDITLPRPYTTADTMEIVAKALVLDTGVHMVSDDSELFVETPRTTITPVSADIDIPNWVKKNAMWWSDGQINDPDFAKGIEYLVQENIISVPTTEEALDDEEANITSIPIWVRNNAAWWSEEQIGDNDFIAGIEYLIKNGIIDVPGVQIGVNSSTEVPDWIKNNAAWWSESLITDDDFIEAMQWLVEKGVIQI